MQLYKQQRVGHYFNLHVRAPSAEVPDEQTRELMPHGNIDLGQHWLR